MLETPGVPVLYYSPLGRPACSLVPFLRSSSFFSGLREETGSSFNRCLRGLFRALRINKPGFRIPSTWTLLPWESCSRGSRFMPLFFFSSLLLMPSRAVWSVDKDFVPRCNAWRTPEQWYVRIRKTKGFLRTKTSFCILRSDVAGIFEKELSFRIEETRYSRQCDPLLSGHLGKNKLQHKEIYLNLSNIWSYKH